MQRKGWLGLILIMGLTFTLHAQEEGCEHVPSAKVLKMLEKAKDKDRSSSEKREAVVKSIEMDPECLPCLHALGEMEFLRAKRSDLDFSNAKETLKSLVASIVTKIPSNR